jgi:hypothetical protein
MRRFGPFTPREKLFMIIMASVLMVGALISLITQIISGDGWWLESALAIPAGIWFIFIIRRSPTIDKRPGFGLFRNRQD